MTRAEEELLALPVGTLVRFTLLKDDGARRSGEATVRKTWMHGRHVCVEIVETNGTWNVLYPLLCDTIEVL